MKRTSQEKAAKPSPNKASTSSSSSKIKDMQKAYGVLPTTKASPSKATKPSGLGGGGRKSGEVLTEKADSSGNGTLPNSKKSRSSLAAQTSTSSGVFGGTSGASTTTRKSNPSSKILAVSKANYAEKYGGSVTSSVGGSGSSSSQQQQQQKNSKAGGATRTNRNSISSINNNNNSPYKKTPSMKSNSSSNVSRLTNQKAPPALYESEANAEDYDEEDFEEDYESDFEEANSTAGEEEEEEEENRHSLNNGAESFKSTDDLDFDKSSSVREFEQLEKMVEVEEEAKMLRRTKTPPPSKRAPPVMKSDHNGFNEINVSQNQGAGEPAVNKKVTNIIHRNLVSGGAGSSNESDEDEEDDDDDEDTSSLPHLARKQSAFPTMTGFSIQSSVQTAAEQRAFQQHQQQSMMMRGSTGKQRRAVVDNENSSVSKATLRGPVRENEFQKRKRTNRGKVIQGMIKLDRVAVDIFHLQPYPYERFMAVFSGADRLQTSTQTDQDRSVESVQTDPIDQITKWTQKPPTWSTTSSSCDIRIVRQEALGVGSDELRDDSSTDQKIYKQFDFLKNWEQLSKFILRASRKMLFVLEAEERIKLPSNSAGKKGSLETIKMNRGLTVLSKLEMHTLAGDGEFVGCANGAPFHSQEKDKTTNGNKKHTSKNLITVWSLKEPSMPLYFLRVWGHVCALKVHMIGRMIISGNRDGSMNVWNLDEPLCYHSQYQENVIRTPSVNTSCMMPSHTTPISGIEMFSESKNTFSLVSIDKEGLIITWSCLRSSDPIAGDSAISQHSSAWSTIHMSIRHQIKLNEVSRDHIEITCFSAYWDTEDVTTGFYFGTFNGYVARGKILVESSKGEGEGSKSQKVKEVASATIEKYREREDSTNPKIICMDISKQLNILAMGCDDGRCRLFELSRKKLVLSLGGKEEQEPIRVKWSGRRASVLYVALKDSLLIWDLLTSDMNPWKTIHLKDIRDFVLYSPPHKEYLVIITGKDLIISTPAEEVKPLNSRDFSRIQSYFSVLC